MSVHVLDARDVRLTIARICVHLMTRTGLRHVIAEEDNLDAPADACAFAPA